MTDGTGRNDGIVGKLGKMIEVSGGGQTVVIAFTHEEIGRVAWEAYRDSYYTEVSVLCKASLEMLPSRAQVAWQKSAAAVALHMFNLFVQEYEKQNETGETHDSLGEDQ